MLRLWVSSVDATSGDVGIGPTILAQVCQTPCCPGALVHERRMQGHDAVRSPVPCCLQCIKVAGERVPGEGAASESDACRIAGVVRMQADCDVSLPVQTADTYRKLRFTLRFLLGNLDGFNPATDAVPYDQLPATDRSAATAQREACHSSAAQRR